MIYPKRWAMRRERMGGKKRDAKGNKEMHAERDANRRLEA